MDSNIVKELLNEASELAGTPQGFLRLIHLITEEIEKIDFKNDPDAELQYAALLRLYIFCKRRFHLLRNGNQDVSELEKLKRVMLTKRKEARKYAKESLNDEKIKTIKLEVGRSISRKTLEVQAL